jgi:phosphate transport system protein
LFVESEEISDETLLSTFQVNEMFAEALSMLDSIINSLATNDTSLAREIFRRDDFINENHKRATSIGIEIIQKEPKKAATIINLLSIIRKIERVGDLAKNLGMEIIFHVEAKVLKHAKKDKKGKD